MFDPFKGLISLCMYIGTVYVAMFGSLEYVLWFWYFSGTGIVYYLLWYDNMIIHHITQED